MGQPSCVHGRLPPLDSPPPPNLVFARSCPPHMGLAGAIRSLTSPLFVGAAFSRSGITPPPEQVASVELIGTVT